MSDIKAKLDSFLDDLQGQQLTGSAAILFSMIGYLLTVHEKKSKEKDYGTVTVELTYKNGVVDSSSTHEGSTYKNDERRK